MIYINEWFPNPVGSDASGEFVELFNAGNARINLDGWSLWTGGKSKKASLDHEAISARGYLVLKKPQVKISLKNASGGLWLYGPAGALIDHAAFAGDAPEGKSFSRVDYSAANIQHFAFVDPTPGAPNETINNEVSVRAYPQGVPINVQVSRASLFGLILGVAVVMLAAWAIIIYKNENLSKFIFKRNSGAR